MSGPPPTPGTGPDGPEGPGPASTNGMPRWVKVFLLIAVAVALAFAVSVLTGVRHGPGLHAP